MKLFTPEQLQQLLKNGENPDKDHKPIVKLSIPSIKNIWLFSELDPEDKDLAFGLCDLGFGFPELGYVYLPEIMETAEKFGLTIENDLSFDGRYPMSVYSAAARRHSRIVTDEQSLGNQPPPSDPAPKAGVKP